MPLKTGLLKDYSKKIDGLVQKRPALLVANKQGCLIRGLLLYFFGKRRKMDIALHFGSKFENHRFNTHCWIIKDGVIRFEVEEVIGRYTTLVKYT